MAKTLKQQWRALKGGDIVDIIAPASASPYEDLKKAKKFIEKLGFTPRVSKNIFGRHYLCANDDEARFAGLKAALTAKDSSVIWCLRGGYGCVRIMPQLKKMKRPSACKLLVGYSDITTLHLHLNTFWNWPTLHASMLDYFGRGEGGRREINEIRQILCGEQTEIKFQHLQPMNSLAKKTQVIRGSMTGGNLMVLQSSIGTPFQPSLKGKFLFLEEIDERGYRVDRMFHHMCQADFFKDCKGVVFGDFVGGEESNGHYLWRQAQAEFASTVKVPVFSGLPCGHVEFQRPLGFGTKAEMHCKRDSSMLQLWTGVKS